MSWRRHRWALLSAAAVIVFGVAGLRPAPFGVRVTFFDVGQGDAIHVRGLHSFDLVVDGGPSPRFVHQLASVMPATDRTLELVVLTHPDLDHLRGLLELFDRFSIERVLAMGVVHDSETYAAWQSLLVERGVEVIRARAGEQFDFPGGRATVLWPTEVWLAGKHPLNEMSIVLRIDVDAGCLLLTGDITAAVEGELLNAPIDCEVLKVPHHGSATSSTRAFLDAVSPSANVIQVGRNNRYGHPAPSVVKRLERTGAAILRTDRHGRITVFPGPDGLRWRTERAGD